MVEVIKNTSITDERFERFLYADYREVVPNRTGGFARFYDSREPYQEIACSPTQMEEALSLEAERGYDFPQIRLARAELAAAQRQYRVGRILNRISIGVLSILSAGLGGTGVAAILLAVSKAFDVSTDSAYEARLNAAAPVAGNPGLTYNAEYRLNGQNGLLNLV